MKIKLTTPNYVAFTGFIGNVQFADGTSVSDVTEAQAEFVRGMHTTEAVEGEAPEQGQELTPTGQEGGETTPEGQELTSEEQKEAVEGAEEAAEGAEQAEQAEGSEAKE